MLVRYWRGVELESEGVGALPPTPPPLDKAAFICPQTEDKTFFSFYKQTFANEKFGVIFNPKPSTPQYTLPPLLSACNPVGFVVVLEGGGGVGPYL